MIILPAIDIRGGRCVRLLRGDYNQEKVFDEDPVAVAQRLEKAGAKWIHVVDLDGARVGQPQNLETVRRIIESVSVSIEMGGGISSDKAVADVLATGVHRIIIGTRFVSEPKWAADVIRANPDRVALSFDSHLRPDKKQVAPQNSGTVADYPYAIASDSGGPTAGKTAASSFLTTGSSLAVRGWQQDSGRSPKELLDLFYGRAERAFKDLPIAAIVCTDISRDGMMSSLDVEAVKAVVKEYPNFPVIASGGVTTVDDVRRLKEAGVFGAIIGRSLYEGRITLEAALAAARDS